MNSRTLATLAALLVTLVARPVCAAGVAIAWNPVNEADLAGYVVQYGTAPHVYDSRVDVGRATTFTAAGLVPGQTYYFTVQAYATDGGVSAPAAELQATIAGDRSATAHLLAPRRNQRDVTAAQIFTWEARPEAQGYVFQIGTTPGGHDVVDSGLTRRTWWTVGTLPADTQLFAQVQTKIGETWTVDAIAFVTAPTARLVYPYQGASDISATETFTWAAVTGAQAYRLSVGTTAGAHDLVDSGELQATTFAVRDLQPAQTLYAEVATQRAGVWTVDAVRFTTATTARFTRPMAADGADLGRGLAWTTILGASGYRVRLGTTADTADLLDSGATLQTTVETPALPAGQPIVARLATNYGGEWVEQTMTLTLAGAALMLPADAPVATDQIFTWTTITNAEAYLLTVGTEAGSKDVVNSGELKTTSFQAMKMPAGRRLYVTVWTKANGVWNGTGTTVRTR